MSNFTSAVVRRFQRWYYPTFHGKPKPFTIRYNTITGPYRLVMRLADGPGMRKRLKEGTEMAERKIFLPLLRPGWHCCDVGAHVGDYMVEMAILVGPQGKVVAYEAVPHYAALLEQTVKANALANTDTRQAAVGSKPGTIQIPREMLTGSLARPGRTADSNRGLVDVPVIRLDDELTRCDAIKIDCEGYEVEVLKGMKRLLADNPRMIVFLEVHDRQLKEVGSSLRELGELLLNGYRLSLRKISYKHCITGTGTVDGALLATVGQFEAAFRGT